MKLLTAPEVADRLGVKRTTLYTCASRGRLRSMPGRSGRERCYLADDVEVLRQQAEASRGHRAVASGAIRWGQPVVDTAISAIGPEGPYYRAWRRCRCSQTALRRWPGGCVAGRRGFVTVP